MHDLPDTEDQDAAAEKYWPDGYKKVIRTMAGLAWADKFMETGAFKGIFEAFYQDRFANYEEFIAHLSEMIVIGAENGADDMFDAIYASFRHDAPLPEPRRYAIYFWPGPLAPEFLEAVHQAVFSEYRAHHAYEHIHEDHYQGVLAFEDFIHQVADLVVAGAEKGADDTLGQLYDSFLAGAALPQARRRPRRLR